MPFNSNDMSERQQEINYKKDFCERWFDHGSWELDVLNQVDVLLHDHRGRNLLYIESKYRITNETDRRKALAQLILTNKKQEEILSRVALIYQDAEDTDVLELVDCSDNSVMYNNDLNWAKEKPSNPTRDAVDRINDRLQGRVTAYRGEEIRQCYSRLKHGRDTVIDVTIANFNVVYNEWKSTVRFREYIGDEQDLINLFLVDLLRNTNYKSSVFHDIEDHTLFGTLKVGEREEDGDQDLIREGTNLSRYRLIVIDGEVDGIKYQRFSRPSDYYTVADTAAYNDFWRKYRRPPEKHEFLKILERSATLYSEQYRRTTGGEYTPACFVEKQVEILQRYYDMDDFIVMDPCAGVGNLENQFGRDYKPYCYLSTLEQMDVDTCSIKGFENAVRFDYLKDDSQPLWKYKGQMLDIGEICRREGRRLMVIMNPPYKQRTGFQYDICIEFFRKVLKLEPDVIVYYCKTEFFLRDNTVGVYADSGYQVRSHIFSNAHDTFQLSNWSVSQVIFDRKHGMPIDPKHITADRYDYNRREDRLDYVRTYTYDNERPDLIKDIESKLKGNATGMWLGQWTNQNYCLVISNSQTHSQYITVNNLHYTLLLKGLNFNTHGKYFETSNLTFRGTVEEIPDELANDAVMFSQFYKGILFSNKEQRNYIMPFTAEELGCRRNDLNVLFPQDQGGLFNASDEPFDFRQFFHAYTFSSEAQALYNAALEVFRFYHHSPDYAEGRDWNDSFYDITNAIMGKDTSQFGEVDAASDRRITRVRTTKGTHGFGRNNIRYAVPSDSLDTFTAFFDARDTLAEKINCQLVDAGLLLWKRENIY